MSQCYPLLPISRIDGEQDDDPQRGGSSAGKKLTKQRPESKSEQEPGDEAENLPCERMSAKDGSRHGEDRSQQRAEGAEGFYEFAGAEELEIPGERPVVPIKAHRGDKQAVGEDYKE